MNSTKKAYIAAAVAIVFAGALIFWQVKARNAGPVELTPEDMALIAGPIILGTVIVAGIMVAGIGIGLANIARAVAIAVRMAARITGIVIVTGARRRARGGDEKHKDGSRAHCRISQ